LALLASAAAHADGVAVAPKVSTLGYGLEFDFGLSEKTTLRLGGQTYSKTRNSSDAGIDYQYQFKWRSANAIFDWHPMAGVFHLSYGAFYNDNKIKANARSTGQVTVGNTVYTNPGVDGTISFNKAAPYLGLGWGNQAGPDKHFTIAFDMGVVYQGSPKVKFTSSTGVAQSDLDKEARELEEELGNYKYYPYLALAIGYKF
jgi:hypothetical protein